jgi:putative Mn2+ efflux pump MntP
VLQIFIGSLALSVLHAAIPSHWLPLVALSRTQDWSHRETLGITAVVGAAHTASTIVIGLLVGMVGYTLASTHETLLRTVAPAILVGLGLVLILQGLRGHHHHHHHGTELADKERRSRKSIVLSLSVAMFFSPCLEIEAYYFNAALYGWSGIALVSMVYFVVTVLGMVALVELGLRSARRLRFHFLDHHERLLTGLLLVALGVAAYFLRW